MTPPPRAARHCLPPGAGLHRELGRLAAICLLIAAIVVLDTLGAVATGGAQTPVWVGGSAAVMCVAVVDRLLVPLEGGWRIPVALDLVAALWPGLGTANPDAHLPDGFVGQRLAFTMAELVPLGLVLLAGFLLARTRRPPAR